VNPVVLLLIVAVPALVVVGMCFREPMRVALPLFALLIPFGGRLSVGSSPFTSLSSMTGLLLVVSLGLQLVRSGQPLPRLSPAVPLWLFFLATVSLSTLWTVDVKDTLIGTAVLASLVMLYVLLALSPADATAVRRTENALVAGASASVIYGVVQLTLLGEFPAPSDATTTTEGRFGDDLLGANIQAVSMVLPFLIALNRAAAPSGRKPGWRALHAVAAALLLSGIFMTASRGGQVAVVVAVAASAVTGRPEARVKLLGATLAGAFAGLLVWTLHPFGLASRSFESVTSTSGRTDIWKVGLAACRTYCLPGSGWGTFPVVYNEKQADVAGAHVLVGGAYQPHSVWLLVAVELGVVGLALFLAALAVAFGEALHLSAARRGTATGALVGLAVGLSLLSSMEFKFFWMLLAYITLVRNAEPADLGEEHPPSGSGQGRRGAALGAG
jgi:O-antigen ligase